VYDFVDSYTSGESAVRTNIDIDDALMAAAMEAGGFRTKKEAVDAGLRLLARRKVYDGLLALRGKLHWDDSDEAWAQAAARDAAEMAVQEPAAPYAVQGEPASGRQARPAKVGKAVPPTRSKRR
jgi:antitoxin ParD1/3/4